MVFSRTLSHLLGILVFLALTSGVRCTVPTGRQLLTDIPKPLSNVEIAVMFPNIAQSSHVIVGKDVTTVITVRNGHTSPLNVTYISGSINSVESHIYLHNFTTAAFHSVIPASTEQSFEYKYVTPVNMPPRQFRVALTVFYEDPATKGKYATTFFNKKVDVTEPERLINTEAVSLCLTLAAIALAIGYVIYSALKERTWFKDSMKQASKASKTGPKGTEKTPVTVDKSDYLKGTPHDLLQRKKEAKKSK